MTRVVGKNVLESLTQGMYKDNKIIFREYIQNATDSLDRAIKEGLVSKEDAEIQIFINPESREIVIRDNGTGIPSQKVLKTLGDIGKSDKDYKEQRGFRGIGRLGGLSYCDELYFITSFKGEPTKTITKWDCIKLKRMLHPNVDTDKSLMLSLRQ